MTPFARNGARKKYLKEIAESIDLLLTGGCVYVGSTGFDDCTNYYLSQIERRVSQRRELTFISLLTFYPRKSFLPAPAKIWQKFSRGGSAAKSRAAPNRGPELI